MLVIVFSPLSGFLYSSEADCSLLICFTLVCLCKNLIVSHQVVKMCYFLWKSGHSLILYVSAVSKGDATPPEQVPVFLEAEDDTF